MLELGSNHRRLAEVENVIRDVKYGVRLNHLTSGRIAANRAWLTAQMMAHYLPGWTVRLCLGEQVVITKTILRRFSPWPGGSSAGCAAPLCLSPGAGPGKPGSSPPWYGCGPFHCPLDAIPTQGNRFPHQTIESLPPTRANQAGEGLLLAVVPQPGFPRATPSHHRPYTSANERNHRPSHPNDLSCKSPNANHSVDLGLESAQIN